MVKSTASFAKVGILSESAWAVSNAPPAPCQRLPTHAPTAPRPLPETRPASTILLPDATGKRSPASRLAVAGQSTKHRCCSGAKAAPARRTCCARAVPVAYPRRARRSRPAAIEATCPRTTPNCVFAVVDNVEGAQRHRADRAVQPVSTATGRSRAPAHRRDTRRTSSICAKILRTRLGQGLIYHLHALTDDQMIAATPRLRQCAPPAPPARVARLPVARAARHAQPDGPARRARPLFTRTQARHHATAAARGADDAGGTPILLKSQKKSDADATRPVRPRPHAALRRQRLRVDAIPVSKGIVDRTTHEARNAEFYEQYKAGIMDIHEFLDFQLRPLRRPYAHRSRSMARRFHGDADSPARLSQKARDLVRKHLDAGDICAMVTATNSFVTGPIARELGIPHLIATIPAQENGRSPASRAAAVVPRRQDRPRRRLA